MPGLIRPEEQEDIHLYEQQFEEGQGALDFTYPTENKEEFDMACASGDTFQMSYLVQTGSVKIDYAYYSCYKHDDQNFTQYLFDIYPEHFDGEIFDEAINENKPDMLKLYLDNDALSIYHVLIATHIFLGDRGARLKTSNYEQLVLDETEEVILDLLLKKIYDEYKDIVHGNETQKKKSIKKLTHNIKSHFKKYKRKVEKGIEYIEKFVPLYEYMYIN